MTVPDIHRNILDNLSDGVLVVGSGGRVVTLNPAAERILGLEPGEAAGRGFAELFIARDGFDDFTQLILDATVKRSGSERQVVELRDADEARSLSVATSWLRTKRADRAAGPVSVIAVFSDISELRELRETELRLAQATEEQHRKLQGAYREIEERNRELGAALRKVRVAQGLGIVLVMGLFAGIGLVSFRPLDLIAQVGLFSDEAVAAVPDGREGEPATRTLTVEPRRNTSSITLKGRLSPWREMVVTSPADSTVAAVHFQMGERVEEGQLLLELDLSKLERRYESKRLAFSKAEEKLAELKDWDNSSEMIKARRSFAKARMNMDGRRGSIGKSRFLFEQGLIATAEFEDAEREYKSQLLDFESAGEALEAVRATADEKAVAAAELAVENARAEMLAAREDLDDTIVRAPYAGMALPPVRSGKDLAQGVKLRRGDKLLRLADFSRIAAASTADEIDVIQLRAGQKVTATGNAFPGLELQGIVDSVAAEADPKQKRKPTFGVSFLLDELAPQAQARVRPGMSVKLRIVTYDNPKALLVPLDAVHRHGGKHWLRVLDPASGEVQDREVGIGPTTRRRVEIASGLKAGEQVVLPGG